MQGDAVIASAIIPHAENRQKRIFPPNCCWGPTPATASTKVPWLMPLTAAPVANTIPADITIKQKAYGRLHNVVKYDPNKL